MENSAATELFPVDVLAAVKPASTSAGQERGWMRNSWGYRN